MAGWWFQRCFIFHVWHGMSSFPSDFHIFQRGRYTTKQLRYRGSGDDDDDGGGDDGDDDGDGGDDYCYYS